MTHLLTCAMSTYLIFGRAVAADDEAFRAALAEAHAQRHRPLCMCRQQGVDGIGGVEMYVARLDHGFLVKRMPFTGSEHAPDCASYEPPADLSGLGHVMGSAIVEDPVSGVTSLKLGFSMSKVGARAIDPGTGDGGDSV